MMDSTALVGPQIPAASGIELANWASTPANVQTGEIAEMQVSPTSMTYAMSVSPDGSTFATADQDHTVKIFDGQTGALLSTLNGHTGLVDSVAFSPNGDFIASTGYDKTIRIWNAATGQQVSCISIPNLGMQVHFTPDSSKALVSSCETSVDAYDVQTGAHLATIPIQGGRFAISPDGHYVVGGQTSSGHNLLVYDMQLQSVVRTLNNLPDDIYSIDIDPTGQYLAAGDNSGNTAIWKLQTGEELLQAHTMTGKPESPGGIWAMHYSKSGQYLIEGNFNGDIVVNDMQDIANGVMTPVETYHVNPVITSIESSQNGRDALVTTADNTQTSRTYVLKLPFTEPPAPDPAPDPSIDTTALASDLAMTVSQTLDAQTNKIDYAKMYVSVEELPTGDTRFHVRYRNPGQCTFVSMHIGGGGYGEMAATEPTADGMADITLRPGDGENGAFTIDLKDGTTGQILAEVRGTYDRYNKIASIDTQQIDFTTDQAGLLAENPIDPSLKVVSVNGTTMLLSIATGYDQAYITSNTGGFLSSTTIDCANGTTASFASITIDAGCNTGDYSVQMMDCLNGMCLANVNFHWDKDSKTITILNADDMVDASADTSGDQAIANMVQQLRTLPIGIDDPNIAYIQQNALLQDTAELSNPGLQLYISAQRMLDLLFQMYPQYKPAYIDTVTGPEHDELWNAYQLISQQYMNYLNAAQPLMSGVFQQAIQMFVKIYQGQPEGPLKESLHNAIDAMNQNGNVCGIYNIPGMIHYSYDNVVDAAKQVFSNHWGDLVRTNNDVVAYRAYCDGIRAAQDRQAAQDRFTDAGGNLSDTPVTMDHRQLTLAAHILTAIKNNPRLIALNPKRQQDLAVNAAVTISTMSDPVQQQDTITTLIAKATSGAQLDVYIKNNMATLYASPGVLDSDPNASSKPKQFDVQTLNNVEQPITLPPSGMFKEHFTISDNGSMVNLSLIHDMNIFPNDRSATLSLYSHSKGFLWESPKSGLSGNSISCSLPADDYLVVVTTADSLYTPGTTPPSTSLLLTIGIEKPSLKEIDGRVSIEGNPHVFPVSMTVAEFGIAGNRKDITEVNNIDSNKPIWLVIHGREDSGSSGKMEELEQSLYEAGYQVVVCDWKGGAGDNTPHFAGLQGEDWIEATAEKFFQLLQTWGISADQLFIAGHSWGSFVGYEIAERYLTKNNFGVQGFVALDSAIDPTSSLGYNASQVNFANISKVSWAFHSSAFGDVTRTFTADKSYEIRSSILNPVAAHGIAVTAFANLVLMEISGSQNNLAAQFDFTQLNQGTLIGPTNNQFSGWLWVGSEEKTNPVDPTDTYIEAMPTQFTATDPDDDQPDQYYYSF